MSYPVPLMPIVHDEARCPVCQGEPIPPANVYRPHTLDKDCWCCRHSIDKPLCWMERRWRISGAKAGPSRKEREGK